MQLLLKLLNVAIYRHLITSKKRSGMISGVQKSEGEDIEWSDKLPEHSRLSQ